MIKDNKRLEKFATDATTTTHEKDTGATAIWFPNVLDQINNYTFDDCIEEDTLQFVYDNMKDFVIDNSDETEGTMENKLNEFIIK